MLSEIFFIGAFSFVNLYWRFYDFNLQLSDIAGIVWQILFFQELECCRFGAALEFFYHHNGGRAL
jgi:hypothetical protein